MTSALPAWRPPPRLAAAVSVPIALVLAVVGGLLGQAQYATVALTLPVAIACALVGPLVLTSRPGHRVGRLLTAAAVVAGAGTVAACWSRFVVPAWVGQWIWLPPLPLMFLALLFFPDGRLPSRRWWPVAALISVPGSVATVALALAALWHPYDLAGYNTQRKPQAAALIEVAGGAGVLCVLGFLAAAASIVVRWRRSQGEARRQTAMLLPAGGLLLAAVVALLWSDRAWLIGAAAIPVALTVAILRHRLYDLDRIVNRGAAWTGLTALVVAAFLAFVAVLGRMVPGDVSLVTIVLVSAALAPLCQAAWRWVDRLVFGDRDDPARVLSQLADLVGRTGEPGDLLPLVVENIAGSLRVPYVAMEVQVRDRSVVIAEYGRGGDDPEAFPMLSRGEPVGRLLVAPRTTGGHFTVRECRLLSRIASQAAAAADSARLVEALRASRERLVTAREEERRRLRRDLHDGIGPTLAGMSLQLLAAHRMVDPDGDAAGVLDALRGDLRTCLAETRQLVDQLRPAALDQGLREGLATECRRFDADRLRVTLRAGEQLDGLPAAVEVAAYRIVAEALTNVARHAEASTVLVDVRRGNGLELEVVDDGVGLSGTGRRGVGLDSMRERAEELGGECEIGSSEPHGTTVRVRLPLPNGTRERAQVVGSGVG